MSKLEQAISAHHWKNFIGGEWRDSETILHITDPSTGKEFATVACATLDDANRAVELARCCADSGELTRARPAQRVKILLHIAENIPTDNYYSYSIIYKQNEPSGAQRRVQQINAYISHNYVIIVLSHTHDVLGRLILFYCIQFCMLNLHQ